MAPQLFEPIVDSGQLPDGAPLAARLRPDKVAELLGQEHLLSDSQPLAQCVATGRLHSLVLWGPPGCGKTSLARILAAAARARFISISAVMSGISDIRAAVKTAQSERNNNGRDTILFVDEVHRFNKAQQDAFLPHIENGTLIFVGATTENPSFELIGALLSRVRIYILRKLSQQTLEKLLERACSSKSLIGEQTLSVDSRHLSMLASAAGGDARRALNLLEIYAQLAVARPGDSPDHLLRELLTDAAPALFDKGGDQFYDLISALHKSVRGSDPDASLYWLARMLEGGCDPLYIARRVLRMASEDIGNADPRGLSLALDAWNVMERLGSPEGDLAIAQAVVYLSCAAKSNACYKAFNSALDDARQNNRHTVPIKLRNAPTKLMRELGHGQDYRYPHDEPGAFAAGESYFPEEMTRRRYYFPVARGLEERIGKRLEQLRSYNCRQLNNKDDEPR